MFSANKGNEYNISQEEIQSMADVWKNQELNLMIRALRPKSYREGKTALDSCLEKGRKYYRRPKFWLNLFSSIKVPKTSEDCKFVPAVMDCFISSSPFNEKFWRKESM